MCSRQPVREVGHGCSMGHPIRAGVHWEPLTPGSQDGAWYRRNSVGIEPSSLDTTKPTVFAATCNVAGNFVCAGIFNRSRGRYAIIPTTGTSLTISVRSATSDQRSLVPVFFALHPRL